MSINGDSLDRTECQPRPTPDKRLSHERLSQARQRLRAESRLVALKSPSPFTLHARPRAANKRSTQPPPSANGPNDSPGRVLTNNANLGELGKPLTQSSTQPSVPEQIKRPMDAKTTTKVGPIARPNGPSATNVTQTSAKTGASSSRPLETSSNVSPVRNSKLEKSPQGRKKRPTDTPVANKGTLSLESEDIASHSRLPRPPESSEVPTECNRAQYMVCPAGWRPANYKTTGKWVHSQLLQNQPPITRNSNLSTPEATEHSRQLPCPSHPLEPQPRVCESATPQIPGPDSADFDAMDHATSKTTDEPSIESIEIEPSTQGQSQNREPMVISDSSESASSSREPSDDLMLNGAGNRDEDSPASSASVDECPKSPPKLESRKSGLESQRNARASNFNSAIFDSLIYNQSPLQPPDGVSIPSRPPLIKLATNETLVAVAANPEIHGMHRWTEAWQEQKLKEIRDRGGRKAWFGRPVARKHWLREQEAAKEKDFKRSSRLGVRPRREPQPRAYKRIIDFSDVPEADLPPEVKQNPAWLKACAWLRAERQKKQQNYVLFHRAAKERSQQRKAQRKVQLQQSALETEEFFARFMKSQTPH